MDPRWRLSWAYIWIQYCIGIITYPDRIVWSTGQKDVVKERKGKRLDWAGLISQLH